MRWSPQIKRLPEIIDWHTWFAWHPVKVHGTWVWLETIERRRRRVPGDPRFMMSDRFYDTYRLPEDAP